MKGIQSARLMSCDGDYSESPPSVFPASYAISNAAKAHWASPTLSAVTAVIGGATILLLLTASITAYWYDSSARDYLKGTRLQVTTVDVGGKTYKHHSRVPIEDDEYVDEHEPPDYDDDKPKQMRYINKSTMLRSLIIMALIFMGGLGGRMLVGYVMSGTVEIRTYELIMSAIVASIVFSLFGRKKQQK